MINPSEYSSIDCATEKTFNQKRSDDHVRDDNVTKRVRRDLMAGSRPRPIVPKSLSEAYRIAQAVCAAKMAPKGLDTPEACMIAIMHGLEVGLSPLSALQRIAVINGRPTLWGDGALALVKASGLCEAIDEWIEGEKPEDWVAVCNLIRKHDPIPVERRFSYQDAKRARLWGKSGPWSDYPKRMLQMRARAFALRDAFPDVLGGLYLTEEFIEGAELASEVDNANQSRSPNDDSIDASTHILVSEDQQGFQRVTQNPEKDYAGVAESQINSQSAKTAPSFEAIEEIASKEKGHSAQEAISENGQPILHTPLPPLANLRRSRYMPRHIRALRFRNQWSIKQPRKQREEIREQHATMSYPEMKSMDERASLSQPISQFSTDSNGKIEAIPSINFIPEGDHLAFLDLFDAALCCAQDQETIIEIQEEFSDRLRNLPLSVKEKSDAIIEKHNFRIEHGGKELFSEKASKNSS